MRRLITRVALPVMLLASVTGGVLAEPASAAQPTEYYSQKRVVVVPWHFPPYDIQVKNCTIRYNNAGKGTTTCSAWQHLRWSYVPW